MINILSEFIIKSCNTSSGVKSRRHVVADVLNTVEVTECLEACGSDLENTRHMTTEYDKVTLMTENTQEL